MNPPGASSADEFSTSLPETGQAELARRAAAAPTPADERIAVIEDSLACFTYGWLACIPFVGVGYLYPAVRRFLHARRRKVEWNPACGYLAAGMLLTSAGWLSGALVWPLIYAFVVDLLNPLGEDVNLALLLPRMLCAAGPVSFFGLLAATETAFGIRLLTTRLWQWVFGAGFAGVLGLLWWLFTMMAAEGRIGRFGPAQPLLVLWATWLTAGFVTLALGRAGRWAWLVWFAALIGLSVPMLTL